MTGRLVWLGALAAALSALPPPAPPGSTMLVRRDGAWHAWWTGARAPARWDAAAPLVAGAVVWRPARPGMEWGDLRLSGPGEAWRVRVVLVRFEPERFAYTLDERRTAGGRAAWTIDSVSRDAVLAFNAGQFRGATPWGWLVANGGERQRPGWAPLATAVVVDSLSRLRLAPADSVPAVRAGRGVALAFQSYPTLLLDGAVPEPLRDEGRGVSLRHRDARLAIGTLRDGRVLVALTRFDGLGGRLAEVPLGLTTPETAALMGALGCETAVMLDGGISAQLSLRDAAGVHRFAGWRRVPLALVVRPRNP